MRIFHIFGTELLRRSTGRGGFEKAYEYPLPIYRVEPRCDREPEHDASCASAGMAFSVSRTTFQHGPTCQIQET